MKKRPITQDEQMVIRMPADLRKRIKIAAEQDHRPEAYLVRNVLQNWLDSRRSQAAA
jgi:predicted DNA-binding protein